MTVYDNTVTAENRESHTAVCLYITTVYDNIVTAEYRERERERAIPLSVSMKRLCMITPSPLSIYRERAMHTALSVSM